jgi:NDP-sugar pyrophosphorylase family protein
MRYSNYRFPAALAIAKASACYGDPMPRRVRSAVLLAAGRGKRLGELTAKSPKPMLEIAGAPLIEHIVTVLASSGIERFAIVVGYLGEKIEEWARAYAGRHSDLRIECVRQAELNGTGAAMLAARPYVESEDRFIFGWGDILMDRENYPRFIEHARNDEFDLILAVNRVRDPANGAAVYVSPDMRVTRLDEKPAPGTATTKWNNAGLFASGSLFFDYLAKLPLSSRGEYELPGAIAAMIADGRVVRAMDVRGFWSDVGTPEDLERARRHFRPARGTH